MTELSLHGTCRVLQGKLLGFLAEGGLRGGFNPLKDRLKLDNFVTRVTQVVVKLVRKKL